MILNMKMFYITYAYNITYLYNNFIYFIILYILNIFGKILSIYEYFSYIFAFFGTMSTWILYYSNIKLTIIIVNKNNNKFNTRLSRIFWIK